MPISPQLLISMQWFNQIPEAPVDALSEKTTKTDGNFMLLKYRADLLYFQKAYHQSAIQYEAVLKEVPLSNSVVHREVTDSLARCLLHVGEFKNALEKAQLLVSMCKLICSIVFHLHHS